MLLNDGAGVFTLESGDFPGLTRGTLGMAAGHLDDDGMWDVVDAQGEAAFPDFVYRGRAVVPPPGGFGVDSRPPVIGAPSLDGRMVRARVHDHKSPASNHDLKTVTLRYRGAAEGEVVGDGQEAARQGRAGVEVVVNEDGAVAGVQADGRVEVGGGADVGGAAVGVGGAEDQDDGGGEIGADDAADDRERGDRAVDPAVDPVAEIADRGRVRQPLANCLGMVIMVTSTTDRGHDVPHRSSVV